MLKLYYTPKLLVKLPIWVDDIEITDVNERNVLGILVNADDAILSEGKLIEITELREVITNFITNPEHLPFMPAQSNKAIISLQNDRGTTYETYLSVYSEIKGAYTDLWEDEAQRLYNKSYGICDKDQRKSIRNTYPQVISEAEPTDNGMESSEQ